MDPFHSFIAVNHNFHISINQHWLMEIFGFRFLIIVVSTNASPKRTVKTEIIL